MSRCLDCGAATYPVKLFCPTCASGNLAPEPLPLDARVYSYTQLGPDARVALVDAGEVRVLAAISPGMASVTIGQPVRLTALPGPPFLRADTA